MYTFRPDGERSHSAASSLKTQHLSNKHGVAQFGGKAKSVHKAKTIDDRPGFVGPVNAMRDRAKALHPTKNIHMAHRLSWEDIKETVKKGSKKEIIKLAQDLMIPQRDFGSGLFMVLKGDQRLFLAVGRLMNRYKKDPNLQKIQLVKALNSSPFNLRPGDGITNSSIQSNPDGHRDDSGSMTPTTSNLFSGQQVQSSDFMNDKQYENWEHYFNIWVDSAEKAIDKL
ncbi:hypothetical protein [Marinoscillum sp.]|uniref:hypothetical protein n=1 Tax=Marinoscillum sp. TaxID=2024838 RepID=UPI003BA911A4